MHLELFPAVPAAWRDDALAEKWRKVRQVRRVVTGALEIERAQKRIGSSLEALPIVHVADPDLFAAVVDVDLAEVCITSAATFWPKARGRRRRSGSRTCRASPSCPNSREGANARAPGKSLPSVGSDPQYPDVTPRDAQALREWEAMRKAAE